MSVAHMGERCACGGDIAVPGKPQEDADGRVIGYRFICAECGATMWTTWTEEYEAEQSAKARHEEDAEALRRQREEEACQRNRLKHAQMKGWMQEMRTWAQSCPAVKAYLDRMTYSLGTMEMLTPAWTFEATLAAREACKALKEAVA